MMYLKKMFVDGFSRRYFYRNFFFERKNLFFFIFNCLFFILELNFV